MENCNTFTCPICGNTNIRYIGTRNGKPYCRKCITFRGQEATDDYRLCDKADYKLEYQLSKEQQVMSDQLVDNFRHGVNSLVHAVCGSGKTEIVLQVIAFAIRNKKRVGFAVPRRDVIRELYERFKYIFKNNKVVVLYGGHTNVIEGDLVCLTTHQLFRYEHYFDLLIVDEIDAFPYHDNDVLEAILKRSIKGNYIMLSATPSDKVLKEFSTKGSSVLRLNKRFHGHPLPVPQVYKCKSYFKYLVLKRLVSECKSRSKQVFVFCPTIEICENTYTFLKMFVKGGAYVHSKREDRSEIIDDFRKKKYDYLVTTAVLERGVTIKDLQVIVFDADSEIYDSHALIQIAGRTGRKKEAPDGKVAFICEENTKEITKAIEEINKANADL